jgi:hypothetical protein
MVALIIIGVLVFVAGIAISKSNSPYTKSAGIIKAVGIL